MGWLSKLSPIKFLGSALEFLLDPLDLSQEIQDWLTPDTPGKDALQIAREGSDEYIPVVYGNRIVGGITVDKNTTDTNGGVANEYYHCLVVFCHGEVESIEEIFFNDVSWTDEQFEKNNGDKWFTYEFRLGGDDNDTAVNASGLLENFSTTNSKYEGLCFAFFTFEMDSDHSVWSSEPTITARIKGKKCYDWRTGTTAYTENPAVQFVDYVKNNIYGKGLSDDDINYDYLTALADTCDTTESSSSVTTTSTFYDPDQRKMITSTYTTTETFKRFTQNTIIDTGNSVLSNIKEMAMSVRGYFPEPDGRLALAAEDVASSVFSFNSDNMYSSITRSTTSRDGRYNRYIVRFPNTLNDDETDEVFYPPADSTMYQDWLGEDNGQLMEYTATCDWIIYKAEALQYAEVAAKASRNNETVKFTAGIEALELDIGDVIDITDDVRGWVNREYRISNMSFREDGYVDITAILHNNTIYPWSNKEYEERVGGVFLGDPYNPQAPTGLSLEQDSTLTTTGTLTWAHVGDGFIAKYRVVVTNTSTDEIVLDATTQSKSYVIPTLDAGTYEIDVYAVTTLNYQSDSAALALTLTAPQIPIDITFEITDWSVTAQPVTATSVGFGTTFEFDYVFGDGLTYTPTPRFDGSSLVATGLLPDTQYTFFTRTANAYGESGWYSETVTTTNTGDQLNAQLDPIRDELDEIQLLIDDLPEEIGDFSVISGKVDDLEVDVAEINTEIDSTQVQIENIQDELGNDVHAYVTEITEKHSDYLSRKATRATATRVDSLEGDVVATTLLINQSGLDEEGNTTALIALQGEVNDASTGLAATFTIAGQAKSAADDNAEAITLIQSAIDDPASGLAATNTIAQQAQLDADDNADAITALTSRVEDNEDFAAAQILLNSSYNSDLDTLSARAFLGTNVNDRVTGITIGDSGTEQVILFQSDSVGFTDDSGNLQIYYDLTNERYVFNGEIVANAGTFSGNVSSATITGGTISGTDITGATVTGSTVQTASSGSRGILGDDGTYLLWLGEGTKNDTNAYMYVKKPVGGVVEGFINGEWLEGELIAQDSDSGTTSASVTHVSKGKPVQINFGGAERGWMSGDYEGVGLEIEVTLTRTVGGSTTTLSTEYFSGQGMVYEPELGRTLVSINGTSFYTDTRTTAETREYEVELTAYNGLTIVNNRKVSLNVTENYVG